MTADRGEPEPSREVRLEGVGLLVVGGVLLAAMVGSFYLGRWVESRAHPAVAVNALEPDPLAQVVRTEPYADASEDLTYFDDLEGREKQLEPGRQTAPADTTPKTSEPAAPTAGSRSAEAASPASESGPYYVQVFAGRSREAAERLVGELKAGGYRVRVDSEREGQGALYKVRVGGYPTSEAAHDVAEKLQSGGHSGAWVARVQ